MLIRSDLAAAPHLSELMAGLRAFLDEHYPREREASIEATPEWSDLDALQWWREFNRKLAAAGYLIPHWPAEFGGRGATVEEQLLIREELAYRRIPIVNINGLDMVAPILLRHGTDPQREHLRRIARVEEFWCQGYSEPEAGSDLGALRTTAVLHGDRFVVNGTKIWTGHAMHADWMLLLARTDPQSRGSRGLSLLMLDLRSPGVTVQPIRSATGRVTFCQEFFVDVEVPVDNLVGPLHQGWRISTELLTHERTGVGRLSGILRSLEDLVAAVSTRYGSAVPDNVALTLGELASRVEAARALAYELARQRSTGSMKPAMASVIKLFTAELAVELNGISAQLRGLDEQAYDVPGFWHPWNEYLYSLLHRIGGGTSEIQRDIIATALVGLPR